jgi:hypothetical protein
VNFCARRGFAKRLAIENAKNAISIKQSVSFVYEGKNYHSSKDSVMIGDTKRYIILRSIKNSTNIFFERDKATSLTIKK